VASNGLELVEELLSGARLADVLLGGVVLEFLLDSLAKSGR
jgi:hypothetical protein